MLYSPSKTPKALTFRTFLIVSGFLLAGLAFSYWSMGDKIDELVSGGINYRYAPLPVTSLSELGKWVGTNKVVRVKVKLLGEPAITSSAGDKLAYKSMVQSYDSHGINYEDDWWWIPSRMEASDGKTQVTLDLQHKTLDHDYIPKRLKNTIRDHKIPPDIAALIAPDFAKLEPQGSDDITVYTLDKGAMVTVFGVVEKQDGHFTIAPQKQKFSPRLIVSTYDDANLNSMLKGSAWVIGFSIALIFLTSFGIFGYAALIERKAQREKEQAEKPR